MSKRYTVKVDKFGRVKIDAEGFTGTACVEATQAVELALGGGGKRETKPEYDQPAEAGGETVENMRM